MIDVLFLLIISTAIVLVVLMNVFDFCVFYDDQTNQYIIQYKTLNGKHIIKRF